MLVATTVQSFGVSVNGPGPTSVWITYSAYCNGVPPTMIRYRFESTRLSPIVTTISDTLPVRRRRRGRNIPSSRPQPRAPPATTASTPESTSGRPGPGPQVESHQAARPPKVTSSPWAKLTSPVTPKMRDRPRAPMAMIKPQLDAVQREAGDLVEGGRVRCRVPGLAGRDEREDDKGDGARRHHHAGQGLSPDVAQRQILGDRRDVDRDRVGARLWHLDLPAPGLVAGRVADHGRPALDGELDTGDRLAVGPADEPPNTLVRCRRRRDRRQHDHAHKHQDAGQSFHQFFTG